MNAATPNTVTEFQNETGKRHDVTPRPGHNNPPIETSYVPVARDREALDREFSVAREVATRYEYDGQTTVTTAVGQAIADLVFLAVPGLRANVEGASSPGFEFTMTGSPTLYDQIRKQLREADFMGKEISPTVNAMLPMAIKRACLIAYGVAEVALFPAQKGGRLSRSAQGISLDDMPNFDKKKYVKSIAVQEKIGRPMAWDVKPHKDSTAEKPLYEKVKGTEKANDSGDLNFLDDKLCAILYEAYVMRQGKQRANFLSETVIYDPTSGWVKGVKKGTATATPGNVVSAGITSNLVNFLRNEVTKFPGLPGGRDGVPQSAIFAMRTVIQNGKAEVSPEIQISVGGLALDLVARIVADSEAQGESFKLPYGVADKLALLGETLSRRFIRDTKDEETVLFIPTGADKKTAMRISPPDSPDVAQIYEAETDKLMLARDAKGEGALPDPKAEGDVNLVKTA